MVNSNFERLETPMYLSLGQAAKECGKSKATLSKALKSGKLGYVNKTSAGYEIDPAELFRVFPKTNNGSTISNDQKPHNITTDLAIELGKVQAQNEALEAQIALLKETVERERANTERERINTDEWRKQAQVLALTDQSKKEKSENQKAEKPKAEEKPAKEQGGFFSKFRKTA